MTEIMVVFHNFANEFTNVNPSRFLFCGWNEHCSVGTITVAVQDWCRPLYGKESNDKIKYVIRVAVMNR